MSDDSAPGGHEGQPLSQSDYEALARFRFALRQFIAFSDEMLASVNLGPRRYQAMLAIKAHKGATAISVGELARVLLIRPNTAAELVNRLELAGLIERLKDPHDRRRALLALTPEGSRRLEEVAEIHFDKLREHRDSFLQLFDAQSDRNPIGGMAPNGGAVANSHNRIAF